MSSAAAPTRTGATASRHTLRRDAWWVEPVLTVVVLGGFVVYATWAAFENAHYYTAPYLSPLYSPCLSLNCEHVSVPLLGAWYTLSPAFPILWAPGGFRLTCYYYRKAYYRSFTWSPPACAVPDARSRYFGETRFPLILQNLHRYFFYASVPVLVFLWWDTVLALRFPDGFGVGVGTLVLGANAALLTLYTLSCHSCRHLCGGHVDAFSGAPVRHRFWKWLTVLNERHMLIAWTSLFGVVLADVYVRLLSMGVIRDLRIVF